MACKLSKLKSIGKALEDLQRLSLEHDPTNKQKAMWTKLMKAYLRHSTQVYFFHAKANGGCGGSPRKWHSMLVVLEFWCKLQGIEED